MGLTKARREPKTRKEKLKSTFAQKALKPGAIFDFIIWEKEQTDRIEQERKRLKEQLLSLVPEYIAKNFQLDSLDSVVNQITTMTRVRLSLGQRKDYKSLEKALKTLKRLWKKVIDVEVYNIQGYYVVVLSAVKKPKN